THAVPLRLKSRVQKEERLPHACCSKQSPQVCFPVLPYVRSAARVRGAEPYWRQLELELERAPTFSVGRYAQENLRLCQPLLDHPKICEVHPLPSGRHRCGPI